jgi:hypothetical protein
VLFRSIEDGEWFFDTELLLLSEERGYRISEVPVDWVEDLDTRVDIASTALEDVKGLLRVRKQRLHRRWLSGHGTRDAARRGRPLREDRTGEGTSDGERAKGSRGERRVEVRVGPDRPSLPYFDGS